MLKGPCVVENWCLAFKTHFKPCLNEADLYANHSKVEAEDL